jgi:hypothetical protein
MKEININYGAYSSTYALTDLYPESRAKLQEALASGEDFTTDWTGCKKEIRFAKYTREGDNITVEVSAQMDDLWEGDDLIYDALWEACKVEEELPDALIDRIRESLGFEIDDHTDVTVVLPASASFEEIMEATGKAENEAEQHNEEMFKRLCEIVKEYWLMMKETDHISSGRITAAASCDAVSQRDTTIGNPHSPDKELLGPGVQEPVEATEPQQTQFEQTMY